MAHELKFGASVVVQSLTQQEMFVKERIGCFSIFKKDGLFVNTNEKGCSCLNSLCKIQHQGCTIRSEATIISARSLVVGLRRQATNHPLEVFCRK